MKKFIITALLAALPLVTFAQTTAFDRFENVEGIETVSVNKKMFEMAGSLKTPEGKEQMQKYVDMAKGIESLRVYSTAEKKHKKEMSSAVTDYLKQNLLEELVSINSEDAKVKIYVNKGGDATHITECLVFVENLKKKEETVLVSMTGDINLKDLDLDEIKNSKK